MNMMCDFCVFHLPRTFNSSQNNKKIYKIIKANVCVRFEAQSAHKKMFYEKKEPFFTNISATRLNISVPIEQQQQVVHNLLIRAR
mgnify:CR=1 FL=1